MSKVWLVWNRTHTQCVGFAKKEIAEQAAGIQPLGNPCSALAQSWRELYADDAPDALFELEEVHTGPNVIERLALKVDVDTSELTGKVEGLSECVDTVRELFEPQAIPMRAVLRSIARQISKGGARIDSAISTKCAELSRQFEKADGIVGMDPIAFNQAIEMLARGSGGWNSPDLYSNCATFLTLTEVENG